MVQDDGPVGLDGVRVAFDDRRAVSDAGIVLVGDARGAAGDRGAGASAFVRLGDRVGAANAGRKVMTLLSTRWCSAPTASTMPTCCARGARRRCWGGSRRRRRWGRFCARSPSGTCASSTGCWARRSRARGRRAPAPATGGWSSMSTASSARSTATASRARRSATRAGAATTRCWPRAPTPARSCTSGCRKGSANSPRGVLRFVDELIARVTRAGATGPKLLRADSAFWNNKLIARLAAAGWQLLDRRAHAALGPAPRSTQIPDDDWQPLRGLPRPTARRRSPRRPLGGRRLIVRRTRLRRRRRPSCCPTGGTSRSSPTAPSRSSSSRPSTASTPSSSSRSATSKTRRSRTSPPAASTPTPPGR